MFTVKRCVLWMTHVAYVTVSATLASSLIRPSHLRVYGSEKRTIHLTHMCVSFSVDSQQMLVGYTVFVNATTHGSVGCHK